MEDFEELFGKVENKKETAAFNPKEVVFKYIRLWPLFIISSSIMLLVVFIYHRYAAEKFIIRTTILIPEENNEIDQGILAALGNFDFGAVFLNEIEILQSKTLTKEALDSLDLQVSYFSKGRIKTIDEYKTLSFKIEFDKNHAQLYDRDLKITFFEGNQFSIAKAEDNGGSETKYSPNQWVETNEFKINLRFKTYTDLAGETFDFRIHSYDNLVADFHSRLNVTYLKAFTSIAVLTFTTEVPQKGVDFLEELLRVYQKRELDQKNAKADKTISFINTQMGVIEDTLEQLSAERSNYRISNRFLDLSSKGSELLSRITELDIENRQLERQIRFLEESKLKLEKDENLQDLVAPSLFGIEDTYLNSFTDNISRLTLEKAALLQYLDPFNGLIQEKEGQIKQLKKSLQNYLGFKIDELKEQNDSYKNEINLADVEFRKYPTTERNYLEIERRYNVVNGIYSFLLQKRSEASIVSASNVANSEVVDPAVAPTNPFFPNYQLNYLVGGALGLIIPLLFIVIRELTFDRIETRGQLERITSIPIIGVIGHNDLTSNLAILDKPKSIIAETFRSLRSNLQYFSTEKELQTILVTSGSSGEGKSFCSTNLASIMAISGKKTVLMGLDLRKPKLYDDFGLTNDLGVSNYLGGFVEMEDIIFHSDYNNLDLIFAGPVPPNPAELLMGAKMEKLMLYLKANYDIIIIDTPPIGIVSDTFGLLKYSDINIYLVRHLYTPQDSIKPLNDYVERGMIKNMAIILNDFKASTGYGYGYNYGYGHGYGYGYGYGNKYGGGYYEDGDTNSSKSLLKKLSKK
jgi:tyrosine-protein kinase Etk/Wzc